ncbi:uncharacterized protein ig2599ANME_0898 [groundwater metagenome]
MMELLVFLILLFGLFGVISAQYIIQYREAYALWIKEIVYADHNESKNNKRELCSKLESLSRETCGLTDFIFLVFLMICVTILLILYTMKKNIPLITSTADANIVYASGVLTLMLFAALPVMLHYILKVDIISLSRSSSIDEKIFEVWYKNKCLYCKQEDFREKLEPRRLYEILAERIERGDLKDATTEDIALIRPLFRNRDALRPHP